MNDIYATNLCGRKIYFHGEYFGKIIADYDFEEKDVRKYMNSVALAMVAEGAHFGWRFSERKEKEILTLKGIPFDANTRGWYISRDLIRKDLPGSPEDPIWQNFYFLEGNKMVMNNE